MPLPIGCHYRDGGNPDKKITLKLVNAPFWEAMDADHVRRCRFLRGLQASCRSSISRPREAALHRRWPTRRFRFRVGAVVHGARDIAAP